MTPYTSRRVVGQWGGAGGAVCEDHFSLVRRRLQTTAAAFFFVCGFLVCYKTLAPFLHGQKIAGSDRIDALAGDFTPSLQP